MFTRVRQLKSAIALPNDLLSRLQGWNKVQSCAPTEAGTDITDVRYHHLYLDVSPI